MFTHLLLITEIEIDSNLIRTCFGEVTVRLGDSMTIEVRLFNSSHTTLHQLRLYLVYYQDYQNTQLNLSRVDGSLEGKMIITGCDSLCLPQVSCSRAMMSFTKLIYFIVIVINQRDLHAQIWLNLPLYGHLSSGYLLPA